VDSVLNDPEDAYLELESEEILLGWYEIEGVRNIIELSRQVRTLLNYKTETITYRFRSNENTSMNQTDTEFLNLKQKFESLALKFITLLRNFKETARTLEEGIQSLCFYTEKTPLKKLEEITDQIFVQIHHFSEKNLHNHPLFLKILVKLTQEACFVRKCINAQFSKFFEELGKNYCNLEKELEILIPNRIPEGNIIKEKRHDEVLIS
jgi:hypothetical protein